MESDEPAERPRDKERPKTAKVARLKLKPKAQSPRSVKSLRSAPADVAPAMCLEQIDEMSRSTKMVQECTSISAAARFSAEKFALLMGTDGARDGSHAPAGVFLSGASELPNTSMPGMLWGTRASSKEVSKRDDCEEVEKDDEEENGEGNM